MKKVIALWAAIILIAALILFGKNYHEKREEKADKATVFEEMEQVIEEKRLYMHFAWKDKEFEEESEYSIDIQEQVAGGKEYVVDRTQLVNKGRLGFSVTLDKNIVRFQDLYFAGNQLEYDLDQASESAEGTWKIVPLLDDYRIFIDDYMLNEESSNWRQIKSLPLFKIVGEKTGKEITYTLTSVKCMDYLHQY